MSSTNERRHPLVANWAIQRCAPGTAPEDGGWSGIPGPGTAAAALRAIGQWSLDAAPIDFDAHDWWFRALFDAPPDEACTLDFGGLAGLAEVWLNAAPLLSSTNMFLRHRCNDLALHVGGNELLFRFASLERWLATRRPRPRWRTPMVAQQQLRWARVSLLGRTPGWSPPAAAVGPWGPVEWIEAPLVEVARQRIAASLHGPTGMLRVEVELSSKGAPIDGALLRLEHAGQAIDTDMASCGRGFTATAQVTNAARWWPHTHGDPALYDARILVRLHGVREPVSIALGRVGFRTLELDSARGDFAIRVNGVPVFCRGACWTPLDVVSLRHTPEACLAALRQVRDAGMNMLRIAGSMVYEDDAFYDACDALGLMVWQDFMFANMDYPTDDPSFAASARDEAVQHLSRWQARPAIAVLCGNSEVSQQAAMWGAPREAWSQPFFALELARLAAEYCPHAAWWPSSAHGGAFPHQNNAGTTAYYGIGAYTRPLEDARRSGLRFATECLAFANLPPDATLARAGLRLHHPAWKARTPRDGNAAWDFEDVRDHYLQSLYQVDPAALRRVDPDRYLALGRALAAEVMEAAFGEWRRPGSGCRGALVWFLRDLWAGAGWGLLDDRGQAKAAFHGLKRALAPLALFIGDEGTNGLELHLVNDPPNEFAGTLELAVYREDGSCLQSATRPVAVGAHGALSYPAAEWFDCFTDLSDAYRFGPATHSLVVATLHDTAGSRRAQAFHLAGGRSARGGRGNGLAARARRLDDDGIEVRLGATCFAQSVHFDVPGFEPDDDFFHLAPGAARVLRLRPRSVGARFVGSVRSINDPGVVTLELE